LAGAAPAIVILLWKPARAGPADAGGGAVAAVERARRHRVPAADPAVRWTVLLMWIAASAG
jgi:hypothetical protein